MADTARQIIGVWLMDNPGAAPWDAADLIAKLDAGGYAIGQKAGDEWQTIDTAPKDGTRIDVCDRFGERTTDVRWDDGEWRHWGMDAYGDTGMVLLDIKPSYWMPIPAPPAAK